MAARVRRIVTVDEIMEGMRDVAFEGRVLNRYGNYDSDKISEFKYLHRDLIDKQGFTTVTLSVKEDQMREHGAKLCVGQVVRVENFGVAKKSKKTHEKGDFPYVIKVMTFTVITVVDLSPIGFKPEFYHTDTISEFRARSHQQWASGTIAACVIENRGMYQGKFGNLYQVVIADGCTDGDYDVLAFTDQFKVQYEQVVEVFNTGICVTVLFKNISTTQSGDKYLITRAHTIVTPVQDVSTKEVLQGVFEKMGKKRTMSSKSVEGTLSIERPYVAPFKEHCIKCSQSNMMVIEGGSYCNICHSIQEVIQKAHLCAKIVNGDGEYSITIEGQWLVALVRMSEEDFLALSRGQQMKMLSTFKVKRTFLLTPMAMLCGYVEHMEASASSNVVTNGTQDNDRLLQTPPKRRLDDNPATPGPASAKKVAGAASAKKVVGAASAKKMSK